MSVTARRVRSAAELEVENEGLRERIDELERQNAVQVMALAEKDRQLEAANKTIEMMSTLAEAYKTQCEQLTIQKGWLEDRIKQVTKIATGSLREI